MPPVVSLSIPTRRPSPNTSGQRKAELPAWYAVWVQNVSGELTEAQRRQRPGLDWDEICGGEEA